MAGRTMNPSVGELVGGIERAPAHDVILLVDNDDAFTGRARRDRAGGRQARRADRCGGPREGLRRGGCVLRRADASTTTSPTSRTALARTRTGYGDARDPRRRDTGRVRARGRVARFRRGNRRRDRIRPARGRARGRRGARRGGSLDDPRRRRRRARRGRTYPARARRATARRRGRSRATAASPSTVTSSRWSDDVRGDLAHRYSARPRRHRRACRRQPASKLAKKGVRTVRDLLEYVPRKYMDLSKTKSRSAI